MKKFIIYAVAALALVVSCQKNDGPGLGGDAVVKFTVAAGDVATKADIADGTNVDILYYEIYGDLAKAPLGKGNVTRTGGNFQVELKLVADQIYNIIFWAQVDGTDYYEWDDLRNVKIKFHTEDELANDEDRAAFFRKYTFTTENGKVIDEDIYLFRPFAQVNVGTTTIDTDLNLVDGGLKVTGSRMTFSNAAISFNTVKGIGEGEQEISFRLNSTPNGTLDQTSKILEVNKEYYFWLAMNYIIVAGDENNVQELNFDIETNVGTVSHKIASVPVKENYRTNILGNILTTDAKFEIIVDNEFDGYYKGDTDGNFDPAVQLR